jgi:hypothetical protein
MNLHQSRQSEQSAIHSPASSTNKSKVFEERSYAQSVGGELEIRPEFRRFVML